MKTKEIDRIPVSYLQFHLSRTLKEATTTLTPFFITVRNQATHLVLPVGLLASQLLLALEIVLEDVQKACGSLLKTLNKNREV